MKIAIYEGTIAPEDLTALLKLFREARIEVELRNGFPGDECEPDARVAVVLYPEGHPYHEAMNSALSVGAKGCRITGVWPRNADIPSTPGRFGHLGRGGTSPWEADSLRKVVQAQEPLWLRPDGSHREDPEEEHHQCNQD